MTGIFSWFDFYLVLLILLFLGWYPRDYRIRTRKMLSYCRRRKSRRLSIEEAQMEEDIGREMKLYCERVREQEEPPPAYWLELFAIEKAIENQPPELEKNYSIPP